MTDPPRLSTGIEGLDRVLHGGFIPDRSYMVTGRPGTGKTILGLHYLMAAGDAADALYVNLEEAEADIRTNAAQLGFDLGELNFLDLTPDASEFGSDAQYSVFTAGEVEGTALSEAIASRVESVDPDRVFVDPLTQLRQLSPDDYQFRKQVIAFVQFLKEQSATVVFTSQASAAADDELQFLSDGMIRLRRSEGRRTLSVPKFRGSDTEPRRHAVRITDEGMTVYPALRPGDHGRDHDLETIPAGVPEIDEMLHGGLQRGTVTIVSGPTGVGKTTLGTQFMKEAAGRGERSVIFMFEEATKTFLARTGAINMPTREMIDRGTLAVEEVEPLDLSPAEFAASVRAEVEQRDAQIVMIDGIDGYRLSIQGDTADLERELNTLCRYLTAKGVAVILVDDVGDVAGEFQPTQAGVSYLADAVIFLRYLEIDGELRKAIGILKKRTSNFQRTLREFEITSHGLRVGSSLTGLRGILSSQPTFVDDDVPTPGGRDR